MMCETCFSTSYAKKVLTMYLIQNLTIVALCSASDSWNLVTQKQILFIRPDLYGKSILKKTFRQKIRPHGQLRLLKIGNNQCLIFSTNRRIFVIGLRWTRGMGLVFPSINKNMRHHQTRLRWFFSFEAFLRSWFEASRWYVQKWCVHT